MPLSLIPVGIPAKISEVLGTLADVNRLSEMGMRPGVIVEIVQNGSPCIVRVGESKLCFRESEVLRVLVEIQ
jgi:Fe2+ transport system protein FeoA